MTPLHGRAAAAAGAIEAEMRRIGWWSAFPPTPDQMKFREAFARDTMAFDQWLQFVFLPRVRDIAGSGGAFPKRSRVGAQAVREFDGRDEASELVRLLSDFDALFE